MAEEHGVIVCGAYVEEGAQGCQEILETISLEKMQGKFEVQTLLYQGKLMDAALH